jgi:hypothetical protein
MPRLRTEFQFDIFDKSRLRAQFASGQEQQQQQQQQQQAATAAAESINPQPVLFLFHFKIITAQHCLRNKPRTLNSSAS